MSEVKSEIIFPIGLAPVNVAAYVRREGEESWEQ